MGRKIGLGYFVQKSKHTSLDRLVPCLHLAKHVSKFLPLASGAPV